MTQSVVLVTANDMMFQRCVADRGPTQLLRLRDCATLLRYLRLYKDADAVWFDCEALDNWDATDLSREIRLLHAPAKVIFIAATMKEIMAKASPRLYWKLISLQLDK
jgi:hypothetical protein